MKLTPKALLLVFLCLVSSCAIKTAETKTTETQTAESLGRNTAGKNYVDVFTERNINKPEMIYPIEYYKNKIIEYQKLFPEPQKITVITKINDIVPGLLCLLVGWDDYFSGRGNVDVAGLLSQGSGTAVNGTEGLVQGNFFELYTFDKNQNIVNEYLVAYKNYLDDYRNIIMEKLPGEKFDYGLISFGDFNNDGINEILSISLAPPEHGYVFTVFGYIPAEDNLAPVCSVPVFINLEKPFPPVEYIENGFRVLEIVDEEIMDLAWNKYVWNMSTGKYVKQPVQPVIPPCKSHP